MVARCFQYQKPASPQTASSSSRSVTPTETDTELLPQLFSMSAHAVVLAGTPLPARSSQVQFTVMARWLGSRKNSGGSSGHRLFSSERTSYGQVLLLPEEGWGGGGLGRGFPW